MLALVCWGRCLARIQYGASIDRKALTLPSIVMLSESCLEGAHYTLVDILRYQAATIGNYIRVPPRAISVILHRSCFLVRIQSFHLMSLIGIECGGVLGWLEACPR